MALLSSRATHTFHLLVDHALIWFIAQFLDFEAVNVVARFWPLICGLVALPGQPAMRQIVFGSLMTFILLVCTPGIRSEFFHFWVVWGAILNLSWISRRWGLLKLKDMLATSRHAMDLAIARIVVSSLTLLVALFGSYDRAMVPHNGSHYLAVRDVSKCEIIDQTGLLTGMPIPGLWEWPRISLRTIRFEEIMLVLASLFSLLGFFKRVSMLVMFCLQLRVFGQQFYFRNIFFPKEDVGLLHIEPGTVHLHHTLTLLVWSSFLLALSPSADMLSVDAILASKSQKDPSEIVSSLTRSQAYGFPINVSLLLLGIGYLASGLSKAGSGLVFGLNWVNCFVLEGIVERHFVGYSELISRGLKQRNQFYLYAEWPSLRVLLSKFPFLMRFGALATVVWECSFIVLVSHGGHSRLLALLIGVGFHTSIYLLAGINFGVLLCTYLIFFPWGMACEYLRSLRQPIQIFHDNSAAHLQMKQILGSCSIVNNLKFVHEDQGGVEEGSHAENTIKNRIVLPATLNNVENSKLLNLLASWISSSKFISHHFCHVRILLVFLSWGCMCWESFTGVWKRVRQTSRPKKDEFARQSQMPVASLLVALLSLTSVVWTSFAGEANAWPFASLPKFTAIEFPQEQVLFPNHNYTVPGSLIGYAVTLEGDQFPLDSHFLLRTEPDYEHMQEKFESEIASWDVDNLRLPLQCGYHKFQYLPPWFLWLVSQKSKAVTEERAGMGIKWEDSLMEAIRRCWRKDALFLNDPEVRRTCQILQSSYKVQYYRREMEVRSGPPWKEGEWTVGKLAFESILLQ